ncbi:hypothetical protein RCG17_23905 [Neobacillus sp. PS3-12]|uniref:hypothetical protein n=1 Tax=Neobacillus sp. PS3-12 TaxID=3070677 RepID=UPI0027E1F564|nr:hypothetical protein [Neobacillus sp. PS3-12]WML52389.1 hypothetical protein RCG17_23905 [Neobacillus sp. PS3-12]
MKKKQLLAVFISALMIFVIAGCSNSGNSNQASASGGNGNSSNGNGNGNAFQKPDVFGEVSTVNGNTVTLKLMKVPQNMGRRNGQNGQYGRNRQNGQGGQSGQNTQNGQTAQNGTGNGTPRGGGMMRQKQYTGQTQTITVPNNVTIQLMTYGQDGMSTMNTTLDQVAVGSTMMIYYNTDKKTIKSIRVQAPRTNGQGQGNGMGSGQGSGQGNGQSTGNGQGV